MMKTCAKIHKKIGKNANPWEGGGVFEKSTWFYRGVGQKTMFVHKGGGGIKNGQKPVHMVYE